MRKPPRRRAALRALKAERERALLELIHRWPAMPPERRDALSPRARRPSGFRCIAASPLCAPDPRTGREVILFTCCTQDRQVTRRPGRSGSSRWRRWRSRPGQRRRVSASPISWPPRRAPARCSPSRTTTSGSATRYLNTRRPSALWRSRAPSCSSSGSHRHLVPATRNCSTCPEGLGHPGNPGLFPEASLSRSCNLPLPCHR